MNSSRGPQLYRRLPSRRRGISIFELLVATALLGTVVSLLAPLLMRVNHVRRSAQQRQLATQVASNCLERITAGQDQQAAIKAERDGRLESWLPGLQLDISHVDDGGNGRRTTVSVGWKTANGTAARPVRLSIWQPPMREVSE